MTITTANDLISAVIDRVDPGSLVARSEIESLVRELRTERYEDHDAAELARLCEAVFERLS